MLGQLSTGQNTTTTVPILSSAAQLGRDSAANAAVCVSMTPLQVKHRARAAARAADRSAELRFAYWEAWR